MLLAGHDFPPDIRVEIEARALLEAGHEITIVCDNRHGREPESRWEGCTVLRVPPLPRLLGRFNALVRVATFRDWHWYSFVNRVIRSRSVDVLHVHDLPMMGTALHLGRRNRKPVVSDLHENYPAYLAGYPSLRRAWYNKLLPFLWSPSRWEEYELRSALAAEHVLVVVSEAKARLVQKGVPAEKITIVENTTDVRNFLSFALDEEVLARYKDDFVILYIGGFGEHRGLDTAIEAMPPILRKIPNARLVLVGRGIFKERLEELVATYSLEKHVTFVEWQPFEKVSSYIAASSVCLVPHRSDPQTEATSPHKLFQYMVMGKPVVVSSCKPLRRVIDSTGAGLVFDAGDSVDLAEAIIRLADKDARDRLGEAGKRAVLEEYNWQKTSADLLRVYEGLGR